MMIYHRQANSKCRFRAIVRWAVLPMVFCGGLLAADPAADPNSAASLAASTAANESAGGGSAQPAAWIEISPKLNSADLARIYAQLEQAAKDRCQAVVLVFSGRGRSYPAFSELAVHLLRLPARQKLRTIAYVPKEALGMTMLAVMACQEIVADEFAQLGQAFLPETAPDSAPAADGYNEQMVAQKMVDLAQSAGHSVVLARAMARPAECLYLGREAGEPVLLDQDDFERLQQQAEAGQDVPVELSKITYLVGPEETLLISGRTALELGLVGRLATDRADLLGHLALTVAEAAADSTPSPVPSAPRVSDANQPDLAQDKPPKAVLIIVADMVDQGLVESIKRRTEIALDEGATVIIYQIDTFGGRVDSAIEIYDYFLNSVALRARTVAYVPTKAISAGALISVACQDIVMKQASKIGDCAPIMLGGQLEGVEREKMESPLRSYFTDAARLNGYPPALCRAMVTDQLEVCRIRNGRTGQYEFFELDDLPEGYPYDADTLEIVCKKGELLTLTADQAHEYGLARAVVQGTLSEAQEQMLRFLESRYKIRLARPVAVLETNWSEEMVRWLTSPAVSGILLLVAMLAIYVELNSPGLGLPGAVAVVALVILFGSKYLIGMANWWEIAVFGVGLALLMLEIFVIPGFGLAGISGTLLILLSLGAMMVSNRPDELPVPTSPLEWDRFEQNLYWTLGGILIFMASAYFLGRYFHRLPVTNRLILARPRDLVQARAGGQAAPAPAPSVRVGQVGVSQSPLRPSGSARFGPLRLTVVTRGEMIDAHRRIKVVALEGNSIVVRELTESSGV